MVHFILRNKKEGIHVKKTKFLRQLTACVITLSMLLPGGIMKSQPVAAAESSKTASQAYVEAMGKGWNLGNTFDGFDGDLTKKDGGENAWGNPTVTKEFIKAIKDKGYDSIRMPMTAHRRYSLVDGKYKFDAEWIARYKEVVGWAVDAGLYVMINLHHDSWIWLSKWDGNKESVEYKTYVDLWTQLADAFKVSPKQVCFETINEPSFSDSGSITAQNKLDMINLAGYNAIRNSGGNNTTRMVVIPTMHTNHEGKNSDPAYALITGLKDENVIATVHYYSEWVFSANLGKTGFDEVLWDNTYTPRVAATQFFDTVYNTFTAKGIGVVVGEWGLLGYDAGAECNQLGEELKYYELMNYLSQEKGISLMFWDNGSGINRNDTDKYSWKKPLVGEMLQADIRGERSSYATDLNTIYLSKAVDSNLEIKLTLNGNTFKGIEGLAEGTDYTYDAATATITLTKAYVNSKFDVLGADKYGVIADLIVKFSAGADWHQYLVKFAKPVLSEATGSTSGLSIPVDFKGAKLRRATALNESGKVGPNSSWWNYLQYSSVFTADYNKGTIEILKPFFDDGSVKDGDIKFTFEFYDGQVVNYTLKKSGTSVTGVESAPVQEVVISVAPVVCAYVGETELKKDYFTMPEGAKIYGTYPWDKTDYIKLDGWPAIITLGTKAQENSIKVGFLITSGSKETYINEIEFLLKDAPKVNNLTVATGAAGKLQIDNLKADAVVSYEVADSSIAKVDSEANVTGSSAGTTQVTATVTQYGRTDKFTANITVNPAPASGNAGTGTTPDTLPKTGSVFDTAVLYALALVLIATGSVLTFKKRKLND